MRGGGLLTGALILAAGVGLGYRLRPVPAPPPAPPNYTEALRRIEWFTRSCEGLVIHHANYDQAKVDAVSQAANR